MVLRFPVDAYPSLYPKHKANQVGSLLTQGSSRSRATDIVQLRFPQSVLLSMFVASCTMAHCQRPSIRNVRETESISQAAMMPIQARTRISNSTPHKPSLPANGM